MEYSKIIRAFFTAYLFSTAWVQSFIHVIHGTALTRVVPSLLNPRQTSCSFEIHKGRITFSFVLHRSDKEYRDAIESKRCAYGKSSFSD